jgi:hypothetical protein
MNDPTSVIDLAAIQVEAFWVVRSREGVLCAEPPLVPSDRHVGIRSLYSGFNVDTERLIFSGAGTIEFGETLNAPFLLGQFPSPVKYGESSVGIIERGPEHLIGRLVFCPFPHQSFYSVPIDSITPIPHTVSTRRALLTTEMERALSALWAAPPMIGERLLILGENTTSYLLAYLAHRIKGCEVKICAQHTLTFQIADRLGLNAIPPSEVKESQDIVFHCSAGSELLHRGLKALQKNGRFVDLSYFLRSDLHLHLDPSILNNDINLIFAHPNRHTPNSTRWTPERRRAFALEMLTDDRLDCLISRDEVEFIDLPQRLEILSNTVGPQPYQAIIYPLYIA